MVVGEKEREDFDIWPLFFQQMEKANRTLPIKLDKENGCWAT